MALSSLRVGAERSEFIDIVDSPADIANGSAHFTSQWVRHFFNQKAIDYSSPSLVFALSFSNLYPSFVQRCHCYPLIN